MPTLNLITGGAGFIGSNLARRLLARNESVRILDNLSTGRRENLADLAQAEFIEGDITDPQTCVRACAGVDYVFHQAALPSVPRSIQDPLATHQACATGTLNILLAARDAGVRRLLYAGSSSAYGDSPALPKREDMPVAPRSPYAAAKLLGEHYCRAFTIAYGMETVVLRYFNVFGPYQSPHSPYSGVLSLFIHALLNNESCTIYGDGETSRDFTYIDNVVEMNLLARAAAGASGNVYNSGCGRQYSLNWIYTFLSRELGVNRPPVYGPERVGDIKHSLAAIEAAQRDLGYFPRVGIEEGLRLTIRWHQSGLAGRSVSTRS